MQQPIYRGIEDYSQFHNIIKNPNNIFEIIEPFGKGWRGTIYKANDKQNNTFVAIKLVPNDNKHPDHDMVKQYNVNTL